MATVTKTINIPSDQNATGRTLGDEEIRLVAEAIESGTLTSTKGTFTQAFEKTFAKKYGFATSTACSSGTAALHCAIAAIDPEPGDEIITSPITDMGAITPIIFQTAIPVFADVDPTDCNVTAKTIERVLSDKTKAIIVTHLFGKPCNMTEIMKLAKERNIPVIEDCAQAYLASHDGKLLGTIGDIGCYSLQQGKQMTCGEGGIIASNNKALARRAKLFVNKAWGYGDENPDHYFAALNYRMSELQGAVALAQLEKLDACIAQRVSLANALTELLRDVTGIQTPAADGNDTHAYWRYCLTVDSNVLPGGSNALGAFLKSEGIACAPRYIQSPAFECEVIAKQRTFGNSRFPFNLARPEAVDYRKENYQGSYNGLERILVLPWNERMEQKHVAHIADAIKRGVQTLLQEKE